MMKFEENWTRFDWVIDELSSGMAFFEGFIPSVQVRNIGPCLNKISRSPSVSFSCVPCWRDDADISDVERDYSIEECVRLFESGELAAFDFFFERDDGYSSSGLKLMFMPTDSNGASQAELTIICFAGQILSSENPKEAVGAAISEMRMVKALLHADALYIGPDGLDMAPQRGLRID